MKKWFTYSFSVWLSFSMLLAAAGVPVFVHSCLMNTACTAISVLPPESCCSQDQPEEKPVDGCFEAEDCCIDQLTIVKAELPAVKTIASEVSIVPAALISLLIYNPEAFFGQSIYAEPLPDTSPPLLAGRELLTDIQVFRI